MRKAPYHFSFFSSFSGQLSVSKRALSIAFLAWLSASSAFAQHYDELKNEKGQVRRDYRDVYPIIQRMTEEEKSRFVKESIKAFKKDNALDPLPRIIDGDEYDKVIIPGVKQRAKALLAFLRDHYSGRHSYRQVLPEAIVQKIITRTGEMGYNGQIQPSVLAFPYGPDIIRDNTGTWRVIEDNPGFIGGPGDLRLAQNFLLENIPALMDHVNPRDPDGFYKKLTDGYKARAAQNGGKAVLLMSPYVSDNEDNRYREILAGYGIETVSLKSEKGISIERGGVYLFDKATGGNREKVGFVALNGEHSWFDSLSRPAFERMILDEVRDLLASPKTKPNLRKTLTRLLEEPRSAANVDQMRDAIRKIDKGNPTLRTADEVRAYKGLMNAILEKKVATNYAPGLDFIGDKELYVYVEDLIRFYLNEEPILRNIETSKFADAQGRVDTRLMDQVLSDAQKYVIKRVDGRGGDAVWVGPKLTGADLVSLKQKIMQEPDVFIVQKYTPLSVLDGKIVDMRVIADVSPQGVQVSNTPWGRGLPMDGNGKVNLSGSGREITIFVHDKTRVERCEAIFGWK